MTDRSTMDSKDRRRRGFFKRSRNASRSRDRVSSTWTPVQSLAEYSACWRASPRSCPDLCSQVSEEPFRPVFHHSSTVCSGTVQLQEQETQAPLPVHLHQPLFQLHLTVL